MHTRVSHITSRAAVFDTAAMRAAYLAGETLSRIALRHGSGKDGIAYRIVSNYVQAHAKQWLEEAQGPSLRVDGARTFLPRLIYDNTKHCYRVDTVTLPTISMFTTVRRGAKSEHANGR